MANKPAQKPIAARMSDWSRLHVELMWAYQGVLQDRHLHLRRDIDPGIPVYYIVKGGLQLETEGGGIEVGPGKWVVITQKMLRRDFLPQSEIISVRFMLSRPDGRSYFDTGSSKVFAHEDYPEMHDSTQRLLAGIHEAIPAAYTNLWRLWSDLESFLLIRENFFAWLRCLVSVCDQLDEGGAFRQVLDERMRAALKYLDTASLDTDMREADVAQAAGLSVSQLNRLFTKSLSETPKQYWDRRKLNAAIMLLSSTATPIKQVAFELGFKTQNYFARWFRSQTSFAPSEYREKYIRDWSRYE